LLVGEAEMWPLVADGSATPGDGISFREATRMPTHETPVARRSAIATGTTKRVNFGDDAVLLCNVDGEIFAIEDVCTHDGGELDASELEACHVTCPRHGATFDVRTGAATFPAILPVRTYAVRIVGDDIFIDA